MRVRRARAPISSPLDRWEEPEGRSAAPPSLPPPGRGAGGDNPVAPPARLHRGPPSRPPPWKGGGEKRRGEERGRRRSATWSGVGGERASSRLRSSPLEGGRSGGGMPQGTDRTRESPDRPRTLRRSTLSPPPGRGPGGDDPPRPPRAPVRDPPPDLPPERGRREEKGGGEKTAAVRLLVRRRGRSRVLPVALLPPGRGEVGRGVDRPRGSGGHRRFRDVGAFL